MKVIPETRRIHYIITTTGSIHDTSAGGLLVPKGSIRPVANIWALTWFIRYILTEAYKLGQGCKFQQ
jgi:hypothetical protein